MHNVIYTIIYFPVQILKIETQHIFVIKEIFLRNTHEIGKLFKKLLVNDLSFFLYKPCCFGHTHSVCLQPAAPQFVRRVIVAVEWWC